jgi:two-component system, OmpR family, response regulator
MDAPRLLIIEDDADIRALLAEFFGREGYAVEVLDTGRDALSVAARFNPSAIVLDIMLPGEDGFSICRRIRATSQVPIIMLTAKSSDIDKIVGLELGADDYLGKPFNPRELLARVRALLRRSAISAVVPSEASRQRLRAGELLVDLDARQLTTASGMAVALTSAEFDLLAAFITHPRRVLSRDQLLDWTRGREAGPLDRTIDVTVSRLRRSLARHAPDLVAAITTVRNGGYLFGLKVEPA